MITSLSIFNRPKGMSGRGAEQRSGLRGMLSLLCLISLFVSGQQKHSLTHHGRET